MPREVIPGKSNEPYAQRTDLGWGVIGSVGGAVVDEDNNSSSIMHMISTESTQLPNALRQSFRQTSAFSRRSRSQDYNA